MTTIQEYASKLAVLEHRSILAEGMEGPPMACFSLVREYRRSIFFGWAKDDPDSPIADAIRNGTPEQEVEESFNSSYNDMLAVLWKLDGVA